MRCHRQLYLFHALTGSSLAHSQPIVWDVGDGIWGPWQVGRNCGMDGCQTQIELCDMRQLCLTSQTWQHLLILEALPSFERRAKASCLASLASPGLQSVELVWYAETGPSSILSLMCLSGTTCQVGTPHRVTEGKARQPTVRHQIAPVPVSFRLDPRFRTLIKS
jgi:hypothetical protein